MGIKLISVSIGFNEKYLFFDITNEIYSHTA